MISLPEWIYFETEYRTKTEQYLIIFKAKCGKTIKYRGKQEERIFLVSNENELQENINKLAFVINLENGGLC